MANLIFGTLCLLSICNMSGGDTANLSLQRRPLGVRPRRTVHGEQRSAGNHARVARSVLAARVVDEHGNTVHLRSTGHAPSRRVVNPFVTSHSRVTSYGRRQQTRSYGGRRLNYGSPTARRRVAPTSRARNPIRTSQIPRPNAIPHQTSRRNGVPQQNFRPNAFVTRSSRNNANIQQTSRNNVNVYKGARNNAGFKQRPHSNRLPLPVPDAGNSVYSHGLAPHTPPNARDMPTFLIRPSQQTREFLDRTKDTGTIFTSHPGQCPVMPQSQCSPLPDRPLPPSCSNDYQCHGEQSKCCYDPCFTINKCVLPVFS